MFAKFKGRGPVVLNAVKHYHKWEDVEPKIIAGVREVEEFV